MNEECETTSLIQKKINYNKHEWRICVFLEMKNFLLGHQSVYTKYPCFCVLWTAERKINIGKKN